MMSRRLECPLVGNAVAVRVLQGPPDTSPRLNGQHNGQRSPKREKRSLALRDNAKRGNEFWGKWAREELNLRPHAYRACYGDGKARHLVAIS